MDMDDALAGHLVASVFEVLLVDAGYEVVPTGVERIIRELRALKHDAYVDLVHHRLRTAPDYFVLDVEARQSWLTEVKFRHYIHPALCDDLRAIQHAWAPLALILAVAEPPEEWTGVVQHIRVFTIEADTRLDRQFFSDRGSRKRRIPTPRKAMGGRDHPEGAGRYPAYYVAGVRRAALKLRATWFVAVVHLGKAEKNR